MIARAPLAACLLFALPSPALAFDNFDSYGQPLFPDPPVPPAEAEPPGGGGGRYFTGSLSDGYTCAVCHFGGPDADEPMAVTINPDPFVDGYRAGMEYEITLALPLSRVGGAPTGAFAGSLELVDLAGAGAGTIALVPPSAQGTADQCTTRPTDLVAAHLVDLPGPPRRQVAGVDDCGAIQLRVLWTAPPTTAGAVWLNAGAVFTPAGNEEPTEDRTSTYARIIPPLGGLNDSGRVESGCAASPAGRTPGAGVLLLALGAALRRPGPRGTVSRKRAQAGA